MAVEVVGAKETIAALEGVSRDLEPAGGAVQTARSTTARELAELLRAAAEACGVPVAPRVARSVKVTRSGVSIGDATPVGRDGAPAFRLVWGSEHGPAAGAAVNHFAVARGPGYWIKPAVDHVHSRAPITFELAVAGSIRRHGL